MLTDLSNLLDLLKAKGVSHARLEPMSIPAPFGVIDITFVPVVPPLDDKPDRTQPDPEMCGCGHELYTHMNGLCTKGCDESKCGAA